MPVGYITNKEEQCSLEIWKKVVYTRSEQIEKHISLASEAGSTFTLPKGAMVLPMPVVVSKRTLFLFILEKVLLGKG